MECPTVRIKATSGSYPFTTINEADFDPAKHERYVEGEATSPSTPLEASASTPDVLTEAPARKRGHK